MAKLTFVIEFEDGKEPPVHAHMEAFGGKVVAVAFRDSLADESEEYSLKRYEIRDEIKMGARLTNHRFKP